MPPSYSIPHKSCIDLICELTIPVHEPSTHHSRRTLTVYILLHYLYSFELYTMAHSYASEYPSSMAIDPQIVQFFEQFYRTTDINMPDAHEQYVNNFTNDAVFVMASKTVRGQEGSFPGLNKIYCHFSIPRFYFVALGKVSCGLLDPFS